MLRMLRGVSLSCACCAVYLYLDWEIDDISNLMDGDRSIYSRMNDVYFQFIHLHTHMKYTAFCTYTITPSENEVKWNEITCQCVCVCVCRKEVTARMPSRARFGWCRGVVIATAAANMFIRSFSIFCCVSIHLSFAFKSLHTPMYRTYKTQYRAYIVRMNSPCSLFTHI